MKKYYFIILISFFVVEQLYSQGETIFDDSYLHELHFNSMDTALLDGSKIYQMVDMVFDGISVDSIGIKEKGNISGGVPNLKVPLKIKTNKYIKGKKINGIKEFTLHNSYQDPSMMREKITYDLCHNIGLLSLRTSFAKVYINGAYWGLYTIIEGKDEMFKQRFDHRDADAIESLDFGNLCFIGNNPDDYNFESSDFPYYKLENGDQETAFPRFVEMIDLANNTSHSSYLEIVENYLNLEDFFKYQAINVYLMNFDSYIGFNGNQIYMYDTLNEIWQVIPWDFNASLNLWDNGSGTQTADSYPLFPGRITSGCIAENINSVVELKNYYLEAMCKLSNIYGAPETINTKIDLYKNQIQEAVHSDWRKVYSNDQFDQTTGFGYFTIDFNEFEGLKTFFEDRNRLIQDALNNENFECSTTSSTDIISNNISDALFF